MSATLLLNMALRHWSSAASISLCCLSARCGRTPPYDGSVERMNIVRKTRTKLACFGVSRLVEKEDMLVPHGSPAQKSASKRNAPSRGMRAVVQINLAGEIDRSRMLSRAHNSPHPQIKPLP